jgi:hypothetical protein
MTSRVECKRSIVAKSDDVVRIARLLVGEKTCGCWSCRTRFEPKGEGLTGDHWTSFVEVAQTDFCQLEFDERGAVEMNPDRLMFPTSHRTVIGVEGVTRVKRIIFNCTAWLEVNGLFTLRKTSREDWNEFCDALRREVS